jgi:branched-chain amino acid transport system permease protein
MLASAAVDVQYAINALSLGSIYALFALGIALIFGIMQLLNFAHGELIMVGGYTMYVASGHMGWPGLMAVGIAMVVLFALAMERVAFRPVRGASPATLLVTSFAVSYLLQNLTILIFDARPKSVSVASFLSESFDVGALSFSKLSIVTVVVTIGLLAGLALFLKKTPIGVQMRAAAEDFRMARLCGARTNLVIATAFGVSGLLAGVAAILLVAQTGQLTPDVGLTPVLIAFVATIIGGMGSLAGAVLGGLLLGVTSTVLDVVLWTNARPYRDSLLFGGVILVLLLRPQGILVGVVARTSRV